MSQISTEAPYREGDFVRLRRDASVVGKVVRAFVDPQANEWMVRVQFGTRPKSLAAVDVELMTPSADPWTELLASRIAGAEHFSSLLTLERLNNPPARLVDSFGSARATIYTHQFVPLLKFLDNPTRRLLVADDVGLGKTIEAGYVLRELGRQQALARVVIVVPARLRTKWKDELERRFDERFDIVGAVEWNAFATGVRNGRPPDRMRWITSYETVRRVAFASVLREFQPEIDLVIFDEAHRLRNPGTLQQHFGAALAQCADGVLLLTATPVQTGLEDLYNLLRLLSPSDFTDFQAFSDQTDANKPILRALAALRRPRGSRFEAARELEALRRDRRTQTLASSELFASVVERSTRADELDRRELVELQQDIGQFNLIGSLVSRTRKTDVPIPRPHRAAQVIEIPLSAAEEAALAEVTAFLQNSVAGRSGAAFWQVNVFRMVASCIPASLEYFEAKFPDQAGSLDALLSFRQEVEEQPEDDAPEGPRGPGGGAAPEGVHSRQLGPIVQALHKARGTPDSKFARLAAVLDEMWAEDLAKNVPRRKVVVFAFFKRALRYLERMLEARGVQTVRIDGDIPIAEREEQLRRFAEEPDLCILLSSEVGGEGLDLQFASAVVNYDLPWNPMVVEQRIGRIDRIGQQASSISIVNLVLRGTVEQQVLSRLYARLGLFEETVGEMDPVLGVTVPELATKILLAQWTDEERDRHLDEVALAIETERTRAKRLVREADSLFAADQSFLDEIESLIGDRKVPSPAELLLFTRRTLASSYIGWEVPWEALERNVEIRLPVELANRARATAKLDLDRLRLANRIQSGPILATFSPEEAQKNLRSELIGPRHSLVRFLAEEAAGQAAFECRAFVVRLPGGNGARTPIPEGIYAFLFSILDVDGERNRRDLVSAFVHCESGEALDETTAAALQVRLLERVADPLVLPEVRKDQVERARERLESLAIARRRATLERAGRLDEARRLRIRQTRVAPLAIALERARETLRDFEQRGVAPFALRMAQKRVEKRKQELEDAGRHASPTELRVTIEDVAVGLLVVDGGGPGE